MKAVLLFLFINTMLLSNSLFAQTNPNAAEIERLKKMGERMKTMKRKDLAKMQDSLMAIANKMNSNNDKEGKRILDSISPKTKDQNKDLMNVLRNRRYDTSYTIVDFSYRMKVQDNHNEEVSVVNGATEKAVLIRSGTSTLVYVESKSPAVKAVMDNNVRLKIIPQAYANHYQSLKASGVFRKNFSSDGHTIKEVGADVSDSIPAAFSFNYDETQNYAAAGASATIKVDGKERLAEGAEETYYKAKRGSGVGANSDLSQAKIAGMENPGENNTDKPFPSITKTPTGYIIKYSYTKIDGNDQEKVTYTEELTAYIGSHMPRWEAVIKPVQAGRFNYEHWLPHGPKVDGSDDKKGDDSLKFEIVVRDKNDTTKLYPGNYKVEWMLKEVTNYPGFCNNYPAYTKNPNTDPDLVFSSALINDPHFDIESITDETASTKDDKGKQSKVTIMCMDYAAWGRLTATITLDDETMINARPYYSTDINYLNIPFDLDDNKLGDYWEKSNNVFNKQYPLNYDDDKVPSKQRDNGDGYTLLEEYRGFAIDHPQLTGAKEFEHIRTDPDTKDAFVYDPNTLFHIYYEGANPSKFNWHYLSASKQQMYYDDNDPLREKNRWVNFNKVDDAFYAEQYALVLKEGQHQYKYAELTTGISFTGLEWKYAQSEINNQPFPNDLVEPLQKEQDGRTDVFKNPMKSHILIEIIRKSVEWNLDALRIQMGAADFRVAIDAYISNVVKHEIGHFVGIAHHKPFGDCGAESCVMRYLTNAQRKDMEIVKRQLKTYCKEGEKGPVYEHVHYPTPLQGEEPYISKPTGASSGDNCYGQITGKTRKE